MLLVLVLNIIQFKSLLLYCIVLVLLEGEAVTEEMAARFVSMIPMISGSTFFPGLFDIWLTSDVSEIVTFVVSPLFMGRGYIKWLIINI
jgi:hypothetical protein